MKKLLLFFTICLSLYLFRFDLLREYALLFSKDNATKDADIILILSGNPATRVAKAVELYKDGYADVLMYTFTRSEEKYSDIFLSQSDSVKKALQSENVTSKLLPSHKNGATSTFDEAYDLALYSLEHNIQKVILVTDRFHTQRAYYAFTKIFAKFDIPVTLQIAGAKNAHFDESNWWRSEYGISMYILEPIKFLVYFFLDHNYPYIKEH